MEKTFNILTATKAECLEKAERMLNLGIKSETAAKSLPDGADKDAKTRGVEFALKSAVKAEDAAFDGRA